jgi:hypothetical protein
MAGTSDYFQNKIIDGFIRGLPAAWATSTVYTAGQQVYGGNSSCYGKVMVCTTGGTSGGAEPTWGSVDATTTDNTVTWTVRRVGCARPGSTLYLGLLTASKGDIARSTAYTTSDYVIVTISSRCYLYKCTTNGTTAGSAPTYTGTPGEAITDGTAVLTEQTASIEANGSAIVECSGNGYSRLSIAMNSTNWSATDSSSSTANPSAGTSGSSYNLVAQTMATTSGGGWTSGTIKVWGFYLMDASTGGNIAYWGGLQSSKSIVNSGDSPVFAIGAIQIQADN